MTLIAVALPVAKSDAVGRALELAREAKAHGADIVEWRVDSLVESRGGLAAAVRLVEESPLPCIVTIRDESEGGGFCGSDDERISAWSALGRAHPAPTYVDIELSALRDSTRMRDAAGAMHKDAVERNSESPRVILSFHDFRGRPPGLSGKVAQMWADECASVTKVVWTARTARDNIEAFEFLRGRAKPTIALCMGEHGLMSRVLAPKFGGFLTYARGDEHGTAPGQPTVRELIEDWGFKSIDAMTKVYAVIGHPVAHSRSPRTHNAWFAKEGVNARMFAVPVAPAWESFKATLGELIAFEPLHFAGAAVTAPHKESALRFVVEAGGVVDPLARRIGAANTIAMREGKLHASNTDAAAIVRVVAAGLGVQCTGDAANLAGKRILVLGAGGTARAAAVGLGMAGAQVVVFNRTPKRAHHLVDALSKTEPGEVQLSIAAHTAAAIGKERFDAIVNATSAGLHEGPAPQVDPLPESVHLDEQTFVLDCVYEPAETPLMARAKRAGARVQGGGAMFLAQAAMQFETWTSRAPQRA